MSAQSGITASPALEEAFSAASEPASDVGWIRAQIIDNARYDVTGQGPRAGDDQWEAIRSGLDSDGANEPAVILYKQDSGKWVFVAFSPESARAQRKMLYASSRATVKGKLGAANFEHEYFCTELSELSPSEFLQAITVIDNRELRTFEEQEKHDDIHASDMGRSDAGAGMSALPIPIHESAQTAFQAFQQGKTNFVAFELDQKTEELKSGMYSSVDVADIGNQLPEAEPRYFLFRYSHSHQGQDKDALFFIYYCPAEKASARQRMFYSTVKTNVVQACALLNIDIQKRLEVSEPSEVTAAEFQIALYPPVQETVEFARPTRPGARGRRRGKGRRPPKFAPPAST